MFKVESRFNGHVYTVYAVSGSLFLIWNDTTEQDHWSWVLMDEFVPVDTEVA